jgi:hypothetical protein
MDRLGLQILRIDRGQEVEEALLAGDLQGAAAAGEEIFQGERHPEEGTTFSGPLRGWG